MLGDGLINLKIEPEVSQIDPTTVIRANGITIPSLIVRRANTTVELRDGQSFAIAGLLQSISQTDQKQLPWLGDVPVLGAPGAQRRLPEEGNRPRHHRDAAPGAPGASGRRAAHAARHQQAGKRSGVLPARPERDHRADGRRMKGRSDGAAPPVGHILDVPKGERHVSK